LWHRPNCLSRCACNDQNIHTPDQEIGQSRSNASTLPRYFLPPSFCLKSLPSLRSLRLNIRAIRVTPSCSNCFFLLLHLRFRAPFLQSSPHQFSLRTKNSN